MMKLLEKIPWKIKYYESSIKASMKYPLPHQKSQDYIFVEFNL
jgi:hypothetical protein